MRRWYAAPLRRFTFALFGLALLASALAASLAVHPFDSEDPTLGIAIADEIAAAFMGEALLLGPDVAAGLIPPLIVPDGFVSLGRVVEPATMTGPAGPDLIRTGSGLDVVVSGRVRQFDDYTQLDLVVAYEGGMRQVELRSAHGQRGRLVGQAVRVVAPLLGLERAPAAPETPIVSGAYDAYVRAVGLAAAGLVTEALELLNGTDVGSLPPRAAEFAADLTATVAGEGNADLDRAAQEAEVGRRLARRALLGLSLPTLAEPNAATAFEELAEVTGLPLAHAWRGVLAANENDDATAVAAFEAAADGDYTYATALRASFLQSRGEVDEALALIDQVIAQGPAAGSAALLGVSLTAYLVDEFDREVAALEQLTHASPFLVYPLQELSFLAFDRDDALAAAEALTVAVELEPESSLFWTNLGWAYYLLGFLERSEEASQRAVELDANQYIAAYNLGLVQAVTGRLEAALESYGYATALDPAVDPEVIVDLENARGLYPGVSEVEYALARLYEAKGLRTDARSAYRRFLQLAEAEGDAGLAAYVEEANERLVALSAPPPPLEILGAVDLRLGLRGPDQTPYHPGDPLFPAFELSTPGDQLPARVDVTLSLFPADPEGESLASADATIEPPAGAVGLVVDDIELALPADLEAGSYRLVVDATAGEELSTSAEAELQVAGTADPIRQLFGRGVVMTDLDVGAPFYGRADLGQSDRVLAAMVEELRATAEAADAALPVVEGGRFDGMSGEELFLESSAADVADFLDYVVASGARDSRFVFVDGYAQWALDGAPTAE